ncbi:PaaI family thioesterase [Seohaeicola saemankumensis]|nr:PaaI family thioesterase [Seohaeicola saemankumensis]MCA0873051.1 PaaI family thioesterase [Seohaeicola saemankumensis]
MSSPTEQGVWKDLAAGPFLNRIGPLKRRRAPDGDTVFALQTDKGHENAIGSIHGGVLTSVLDQALAITAWNAADRQPTVTLQMDTRFVTAARSGDLLEARAVIRHATRSLLFLDADLVVGDRLVATATAVMKIVPNKDR